MSILCSITYYFLTGLHDILDTFCLCETLQAPCLWTDTVWVWYLFLQGWAVCPVSSCHIWNKLRNCLLKSQGKIWLQLQWCFLGSNQLFQLSTFDSCETNNELWLLRLSLPQLFRKGLHRNMRRPNAGSRNMPGNKCLPALVAAPQAFACVQLPSHVSRMLICSYGFIWHAGNAGDTSLSMSRVPSWNVFLSVIFSFLPLSLGAGF